MIKYIDVEREVREVYRLHIDPKLAAVMTNEQIMSLALEKGELVSQVEYEKHLVDQVEPETPMHDKYMREREFWDV